MESKRLCHEGNEAPVVPVQKSNRRLTLATAVRDVMRGLSVQEFVSKLEPFIRKLVREEVERGILLHIHSSPRPALSQIELSGSRGWKLHFVNKLPETFFTGGRIETEDKRSVEVAILDVNSKNIVTSGTLSSIKVEILVLEGDFGAGDGEHWTEKEFDASVLRKRDGKRPLLTGDLVITLKEGNGSLGNVTITDNSSWIRSGKFRLGARAVKGTFGEDRIKEAISEAFTVKDHRGELYQKHDPPFLGDEIWRLKKIGRDGVFHRRLASYGINTVQDFLRLLVTNPSSLHNILRKGMSNRTCETIIRHAMTCVLDNKLFFFYSDAQKIGLLFNSIYKVVGAIFDGQNYQPLDELTTSQMFLVEALKQHAYKNQNDMVELDESSVVGTSIPLPSVQVDSCSGPSLSLQHPNFPINHQDEIAMQLTSDGPDQPSCIMEDCGQLEEVAAMKGCYPLQVFTPVQSNSFKMNNYCTGFDGNDRNNWAPDGSPGPVSVGHLAVDGFSQVQMADCFPFPALWDQENGLFLASSNVMDIGSLSSPPNLSVHISRSLKASMGWFKIRTAVKWGISVRRDVAARRMARLSASGLLGTCY